MFFSHSAGDFTHSGGWADTPPIYFVDSISDLKYYCSKNYKNCGPKTISGVPDNYMYKSGSFYYGAGCEATTRVTIEKWEGNKWIAEGVNETNFILRTNDEHSVKFEEEGTYRLTYTTVHKCSGDVAATYKYNRIRRINKGKGPFDPDYTHKSYTREIDGKDYTEETLYNDATYTYSKNITVTKPNSPPTQPGVNLTPDQPVAGDDLTCTITNTSTDPDEDYPITYTYKWYRNNSEVVGLQLEDTTATTYTISPGIQDGETWTCYVCPKDSRGLSGPCSWDSVVVSQQQPQHNCSCNSSLPGICCTDPWKSVNCGFGCDVDNGTSHRGNGTGICANCSLYSCSTDEDCPYNCQCNTTTGHCQYNITLQQHNCSCSSDDPEVCSTDPWKNATCGPGCMVGDPVHPRETGSGTCVECSVSTCPGGSDAECPYNCLCVDNGDGRECTRSTLVEGAKSSGSCSDGIDNDNDGKLDCADEDCCADPSCLNTYKLNGEGAFGYVCCADGFDNDLDGLTDMDDPQCSGYAAYNGEFNAISSSSEIHTFAINFSDKSLVNPSPPSVSWRFGIQSHEGDCIANTPDISLTSLPAEVPYNGWDKVGDLTLATYPDSYCIVVLNATPVADPEKHVLGFYSVSAMTVKLCPTCSAQDVPAVMHPLGIYTTDPTQTALLYSSTVQAVNSLSGMCGTDCYGYTSVEAKLNESILNKEAAELYLNLCDSSSPSTCRLSQYYSHAASTLANEGRDLLCTYNPSLSGC